MSARLRVVGWQVAPVVMVDDGDNLTPLSIGPQMIPAAQWESFKSGGDDDALDSIRAQVEPPALALLEEDGRVIDEDRSATG